MVFFFFFRTTTNFPTNERTNVELKGGGRRTFHGIPLLFLSAKHTRPSQFITNSRHALTCNNLNNDKSTKYVRIVSSSAKTKRKEKGKKGRPPRDGDSSACVDA